MTVSSLWYDLGFSGWNSTCLGRPCLERIVAAYKYGRRWIDEIKIHLRYTRSPGPSSLAHFTRTRPCPSPKQASAASTLRSRRPDGITKLPGVASKHPTLSAFPGCPRSVDEIDGVGTGTREGIRRILEFLFWFRMPRYVHDVDTFLQSGFRICHVDVKQRRPERTASRDDRIGCAVV
jgi:hypothetical protein